MSDRKSNNHRSDILYDLTIEKCGFDPREIGWQKKKIWAICRYCGEPHEIYGANYRKNRTGFHPDGSACHNECRIKEIKEAGSPFSDPDIKAKAQTNRTKNTSLEEINKKISIGRKKAQKQIEATCMEKYGVANPFQSQEIKEKIKETVMNKYGVESVANIPLIIEKKRQTCLEKFGVENPVFNEDIQIKISQSWKERVKNNPELYPIISVLRSDNFWERIKNGEYLWKICESLDMPYQTIASMLSRKEFKDDFRSIYTYPKRQKQNSIADAIKKLGYNCQIDAKKIIDNYELDIYIPEKQIAIEFNGSAWHSELMLKSDKARQKHNEKTKLCRQKGIELIHIFEKTWDLRQVQVMNLLKAKLGANKKIFARKCTFNNDHCPNFINNNHIQVQNKATLKYFNLVYDGQIVASMTAAMHHKKHMDGTIILSRLCSIDGITVVGGASRMFKHFKEWAISNGYINIISWSDNIYTEGNVYTKLGFSLAQELEPDCFYWDMKNNQYLSKQSQSKKKSKCPIDLTEREWALQRGLYRIWDCGKKRWEYSLKNVDA